MRTLYEDAALYVHILETESPIVSQSHIVRHGMSCKWGADEFNAAVDRHFDINMAWASKDDDAQLERWEYYSATGQRELTVDEEVDISYAIHQPTIMEEFKWAL